MIEDINLMFSNIMFLDYGGANYKQDHIILFGNKSYVEEGKTEEDYHWTSLLTILIKKEEKKMKYD